MEILWNFDKYAKAKATKKKIYSSGLKLVEPASLPLFPTAFMSLFLSLARTRTKSYKMQISGSAFSLFSPAATSALLIMNKNLSSYCLPLGWGHVGRPRSCCCCCCWASRRAQAEIVQVADVVDVAVAVAAVAHAPRFIDFGTGTGTGTGTVLTGGHTHTQTGGERMTSTNLWASRAEQTNIVATILSNCRPLI